MAVIVRIDRTAIYAMTKPGGPLYLHFLRTLAKVDALSKAKYLSGGMVNVRTGNLRSSQGPPHITTLGARLVGTLENHAEYALAVHEGTRPHIITGRRTSPATGRAKILRFQAGGGTVFAATVNHPGTTARPFLRDALREVILAGRA